MNNLELVTTDKPLLHNEVEQELTKLAELYKGYNVPKIDNAETRDTVTVWLGEIKSHIKNLKDKEAGFTRPLKVMADKIRSRFAVAIDILELAEKESKNKILAYNAEVKRIAEEAARRQQEEENRAAEKRKAELIADAEAEALFGSKESAEVIKEQAEAVKPASIGVVEVKQKNVRTIWKYKIVNKDLIPKDYMQPNETLIGSIVRSSKGEVNIPGVEVYSETILAAGAI